MKKGGKTKARVTHIQRLLPPYIHTPKVWASFIITTLVPCHVAWSLPYVPTPFHHHFTYHLPLEGCTLDMSFP